MLQYKVVIKAYTESHKPQKEIIQFAHRNDLCRGIIDLKMLQEEVSC